MTASTAGTAASSAAATTIGSTPHWATTMATTAQSTVVA
jgi:hypothetical protein